MSPSEEEVSIAGLGHNITTAKARAGPGSGAGSQTKLRSCYDPLDNLSERSQTVIIIICAGIFIGCNLIIINNI